MSEQIDKEYISQLVHKWKKQALTEKEHADLMHWESSHDDSKLELPDEADHPAKIKVRIYQRLQKEINEEKSSGIMIKERKLIYRRIQVAAAVLFIALAFSMYFLVPRQKPSFSSTKGKEPKVHKDEIVPGGNRATLTLANGQVIDLNEEQEEIVFGKELTYRDGTAVLGTDDDDPDTLYQTGYYTLSTPKGGTYQVTLPDGTKVWLNSVSKLLYPSRFDRENREIQLSGEAFFEVKPNKKQPFVVITPQLSITVLGTSFNVSAYDDEPYVSTTVVHGLVRVHNDKQSMLIAKGENALLSQRDGRMTRHNANMDQALAWKNGYFHFDGVPIQTIMRQLQRWYDLEVVYEKGQMSTAAFSGMIQRKENVGHVFEILEETGLVAFQLEGRKITVKTIKQPNN